MDDDLESKIKQIGKMLGKEDIPDDLSNLISQLASSFNNNSQASNEAVNNEHAPSSQADNTNDAKDMLALVSKLSNMTSLSKNDPKVHLLNSLRPFMGDKRQDKLNKCIKFIGMSKIAKNMDFMK